MTLSHVTMNRLLSLCFVLLSQLAFTAQVGWAEEAPTYTLTTAITPVGAGSVKPSGPQQLAAGAKLSVRTYNNTDFVFKHWALDDSVVSTSASFTFSMPARNCTLTAVYRYDPSNPANPSLPTTKYKLTLKTKPTSAGTFSRSSGEQFSEGQSVSVTAYNNTDFVFSHWMENGSQIASSSSFNYTMPAHDTELTAVFDYNPGNPANPDTAKVYYTVTLATQPANAGTFNCDATTKHVAGSSNYVYAYANSDFVFREWQQDGQQIGTASRYDFQMPAENIKLVAVYDYNPSNPSNPKINFGIQRRVR